MSQIRDNVLTAAVGFSIGMVLSTIATYSYDYYNKYYSNKRGNNSE